jgi:hypothetical protein
MKQEVLGMNVVKQIMLLMVFTLSLPVFAGTPATVYKDPNCGCCEEYANYLNANGYDVKVVPTSDLASLRKQHEVPEAMAGCHSTHIKGYIFEGHIPVASINRFLKEQPKEKGLSVPGMPAGSPGMGGTRTGPLNVYYLGSDEKRLYASH